MSVQVVYLILFYLPFYFLKMERENGMRLDGWICEKDPGGETKITIYCLKTI